MVSSPKDTRPVKVGLSCWRQLDEIIDKNISILEIGLSIHILLLFIFFFLGGGRYLTIIMTMIFVLLLLYLCSIGLASFRLASVFDLHDQKSGKWNSTFAVTYPERYYTFATKFVNVGRVYLELSNCILYMAYFEG